MLALVMSPLSGIIPSKPDSTQRVAALAATVHESQSALLARDDSQGDSLAKDSRERGLLDTDEIPADAVLAEPGVKKQSVEAPSGGVPGSRLGSRLATVTTTEWSARYAFATPAPLATVTWWDRLAWCETAGDWRDRGTWSGGLGIYTQTWEYWGGLEFAPVPWRASRSEQITVANRIASQGWLRGDGSVKEPVGYGGWGGLHCAGAVEEVGVSDERAYTRQQLAQMRSYSRLADQGPG